jgi:hypothetical protein
MNITVTVDEVTLDTVVHSYDGDQVTIGDRVVSAITSHLVASKDVYPPLRDQVSKIRDEEIREQVRPLITDALTEPVKLTNEWGDPVPGVKSTTLRDIIVTEARRQFTTKADTYSRSGQTILQKLVADEVSTAFRKIITDEVKAARAEVATQIGAMVADAVAAGMRKQ